MIFRGIYSVLPLPSLNGWKVVWFNYVMIDHLVWFPRKEKYKGDLHVTFKYGLQFLSLSLSVSYDKSVWCVSMQAFSAHMINHC